MCVCVCVCARTHMRTHAPIFGFVVDFLFELDDERQLETLLVICQILREPATSGLLPFVAHFDSSPVQVVFPSWKPFLINKLYFLDQFLD